ncbi:MAG: trypsin-like peptidase domain-containing protein, partial [Candidatus Zixiibacteriota bacterium]
EPGYSTSSGSGFFFREDGYILTNNHVIQNAQKVTVRTASGYDYEAEVVGTDPETDLAVLKVDPEEEITVIPFGNSDRLKVGDWAVAIGNPFPQQGLERTVTVGVVSAIGRSNLYFGRETPHYQYYIQTDASINPGNSGGPLLNLRGECIGVNAAISTPTGASVGIGFAIPINLARAIVPDLIAYGKPKRGWLGIGLSPVTVRDAKRQGLPAVKGVKIDSVFQQSPAERAGLQQGDIVVGFNGQEVESPSQLSVLVSTVDAGEVVPIEVIRDGERRSFSTLITDRDSFLASLSERDEPEATEIGAWMGMELTTFTPDLARALGIDFVKGVYVQGVYPGSPADQASIAKGTIITQINKKITESLADIKLVAESGGTSDGRFALIVQEPDGTIARKVIRQR